MENIDIEEEVKGDIKVRIYKLVYNSPQHILFDILPIRIEIGCNSIYCVSPSKTPNNSSKSQHANHMAGCSQGTSGLGGRSY